MKFESTNIPSIFPELVLDRSTTRPSRHPGFTAAPRSFSHGQPAAKDAVEGSTNLLPAGASAAVPPPHSPAPWPCDNVSSHLSVQAGPAAPSPPIELYHACFHSEIRYFTSALDGFKIFEISLLRSPDTFTHALIRATAALRDQGFHFNIEAEKKPALGPFHSAEAIIQGALNYIRENGLSPPVQRREWTSLDKTAASKNMAFGKIQNARPKRQSAPWQPPPSHGSRLQALVRMGSGRVLA